MTHASLDWFGVFVILWLLKIKAINFRYTSASWAWGIICSIINAVLPANWMVPFVEWLHFVSIGMVVGALLWPAVRTHANKSEVAKVAISPVKKLPTHCSPPCWKCGYSSTRVL